MLADELDQYKGKGNKYVDENVQEIQGLYMEEETRRNEGWVEDEEVILLKPYEVSSLMSISTHSTSFIDEEIKNLIKYMKFIKTPTQTKIVTNFIQLVSPQPVDQFSQTKLHWKAPNEGYPYICEINKSDSK